MSGSPRTCIRPKPPGSAPSARAPIGTVPTSSGESRDALVDRFLRSPDLRNVLYESAGGRCQDCGVQLEKGWHADHVMPWAVSQRTNVHEMQALCPNCNTRKGSKMRGFRFDVDLSEFRVHQRRAYDTIVDRIRDGEKTTGIVLPPRYGKSDVMRMSAARLIADAHISRAFFIKPNVVLTAQLVNNRKVQDMATRYRLGPSSPDNDRLDREQADSPVPECPLCRHEHPVGPSEHVILRPIGRADHS